MVVGAFISTADRFARLCTGWLPVAMFAAVVGLAFIQPARAAQAAPDNRFAKLIGDVKVGDVPKAGAIAVPFITWGGDVPTFVANGGLTTVPGSIYAQSGLNIKLYNGDDFVGQVKKYLSGESPMVRGELRMFALAGEVMGADPRTKPVVFMQLTWSAGDHMVGRASIKTLNDLKGKRIVLQRNGPHVGMLDDVLRNLKLGWGDVQVVWVDALTGPGSPADAFRKDANIDACFVISPDMQGLTGGLTAKGTGAEGTVKDARVVVSTAEMSRALADVYAVRKDYYDANRATVEKFVAGYFKATEQVVKLRNEMATKGMTAEYRKVLELAQKILGKEVLPTLEADAHGLLLDATFVGLPGNRGFFQDKGNLDGFDAKQKTALDLALGQGYVSLRAGMFAHDLDYATIAQLGGLTKITAAPAGSRFGNAESVDKFPGGELDDKTIFSFTIAFQPNQDSFPAEVYAAEFQRAVQAASTFGSAVVAVRGHADPTKVLVDFLKAGMEKKVIARTGTSGNFKYSYNGKPLELANTAELLKLIGDNALAGAAVDPRETLQAALNLSRARAEAVRDAILAYAQREGLRIDKSQIQPTGIGVGEPVVATPKNQDDAKQNMRVEFRIIRVPAESIKPADFDY